MDFPLKQDNSLQQNLYLNIKHVLNTQQQSQSQDPKNNFNPQQHQQQLQSCWKILIYDDQCQESLSTIFKVGDLRNQNVTVYFNINDPKREKLQGIDVVYFITPTQQNIDLIISDFKKDLYDQIHLNFSSPIEKKLLQKLASQIGKLQASYKIRQVRQHALSFITLNQNLFTFNLENTFLKLSQKQEEITQQLIEKIGINLYSVCRTLKTIPNIIYHSDDPYQKQIIDQLEKIFKEQLTQQQFDSAEYIPYNLILYSRQQDLGSVLMHPWHYAALIHDQIAIKNNKIEFKIDNSQKIYDLDPQNDDYWKKNFNSPLKDVMEDAPQQVEKWTREYEKMVRKSDSQDYQEQQNQISNALSQVTEMKATKKKLEMHTNIAEYLASQVEKKDLILTYDLAQDIISQGGLQKEEQQQFQDYLQNPNQAEFDKVRLMIIYILYSTSQENSQNLLQNFENSEFLPYLQQLLAQQSKGPDSKRDKLLSFAKNIAIRALKKNEADNIYIINLLKQITSTSNLMEQAIQNIPNLSLYELPAKNSKMLSLNNRDLNNKTNNTSNFIIFCLEGHTLNEYQALCQFQTKHNKNIVFGGSSLLSASELLQDIKKLQN